MTSNKILPIIVGAVILILGLCIFFVNEGGKKHFKTFTVSYNSQKTEFDKLNTSTTFVVGNVTFWVTSVNHNTVSIISSDSIEEKTEFDIALGQTETACFSKNDCVYFSLN